MRLLIVIINYRTADLTINCLASLNGQVDCKCDHVVVIDNGSGDQSADLLESAILERGWEKWVSIRRSPVNGGFAAGNNMAIRNTSAKFYLLLNSDTVVPPDAISGLLDAMERMPEAGLLGPSFEDGDGRWSASCFRDFHPVTELLNAAQTGILTRLLSRFAVVMERSEQPVRAEWIGFACVLIRQEVVQGVGLLDDGFFMYFEDVDYCRRARDAGYQIIHWPHVRITHLEGASARAKDRGVDPRRWPRYYYESRARYYYKYYGRAGLLLANIFWSIGRVVAWGRERIGRRQPHSVAKEWRDIWSGSFGRFDLAGKFSVTSQ